MPIRPEDRLRYPADWRAISHRIREDRAGGRCECTGQCGALHTPRCEAEHGYPHPNTESPVVLTVAHLDRTPEHNADANLLAMCQDCHLAYDLEDHVAQAMWTRSVNRLGERRNHELFAVPLGHAGPRKAPEPTLPLVWMGYDPGSSDGAAWAIASAAGRIVARGKMDTLLVEFANGTRRLVTRHELRPRRIGGRG